MDKMTDSRAVEVLAAIREDGGVVDEAAYVAAIDHAIASLREPAEAQAQGGGEVVAHLAFVRAFLAEYDEHEEGEWSATWRSLAERARHLCGQEADHAEAGYLASLADDPALDGWAPEPARRTAPPSAPVGVDGGAWTDADMEKPCGAEVAFLRRLSEAHWVPAEVGGMLRHSARLLEHRATALRSIYDLLNVETESDAGAEIARLHALAQQPAADEEAAVDRVAKAIADVVGHGMTEKCEAQARAAIAALAQQPAAAWQAIVEACVITEAVTPDAADPRGTLHRLIDYHVALDRDQQPVSGRPVLVDSTVHADIANRMYGEAYGIDWVYHDDRTQQPAADSEWIKHPQTIEAKAQWDAVAKALGADPDCPDAVLAAAQAKPGGSDNDR